MYTILYCFLYLALYMAVIFVIQDGDHKCICDNANITFRIPYFVTFSNMYSLKNLQKLRTKIHNEPD